jgi:Glycosyl hydrolase family 79 C-terminal beta domain
VSGAAAFAVALGLFACTVATGVASAASSVRVSVASTQFGRPIGSSFLGVALEYRSVPQFIGRNPRQPNSVFAQLVRNLTPGQQPLIRIGGESTDRTWWPIPHMHQPFGITDTLTPTWITSARTLADMTGGRLLLGLNLEANRLKIIQTEAQVFVRGIGRNRIAAFEIGNEPELYTVVPWYELQNGVVVPWYHKHHGTPVLSRRRGYSLGTYTGEFSRFRKVLPNIPLDGPSTGNPHWLVGLQRFVGAESPLSTVTFHRYGLNGCITNPSNQAFPSVPNLLSEYASRGIMSGVQPYISLAHSRGVGFRMDEMNSVTCGGRPGVSNTFASALWVLDAMFNMASQGVDGVNIHTFPGNTNGLFDFTQSGSQWQGTVHPEYYGLLMFAQAPPGARLLRTAAPRGGDVRLWATRAPGGNFHVVLINDSLSNAHTVRVRAPRGAGPATLERLQAPGGAYATGGVTLAGLTFGSQTTTGLLTGTPQTTHVTPGGGRYSVKLPAASAAMLSWKAG